jgi:antitoxin CptB
MNEFSQLRWHCRRGMKEVDVLLQHYLECGYPQALLEEQVTFRILLALPDTQVYAYLMGSQKLDNDLMFRLVEKIKLLYLATGEPNCVKKVMMSSKGST